MSSLSLVVTGLRSVVMNVRPVVTDVHLVVTDVSHTGLPHGTTKAREKETDDGRWGREGKEGMEKKVSFTDLIAPRLTNY